MSHEQIAGTYDAQCQHVAQVQHHTKHTGILSNWVILRWFGCWIIKIFVWALWSCTYIRRYFFKCSYSENGGDPERVEKFFEKGVWDTRWKKIKYRCKQTKKKYKQIHTVKMVKVPICALRSRCWLLDTLF